LGDEKHWVRSLPGKLLQNVTSHGIAKIAEFLVGPQFTINVQGRTSPALRSLGETDIIDELRVLISTETNLTAYFTFTTQVAPPVQELRLFGPKGSIVVDNLHRTVVYLDRSNAHFKSYLNSMVPPGKLARQYAQNMWSNVAAFLKADFHMDAGMKYLTEAFYRSIQFGAPLPISYREISLTAAIMDEIFRQLTSEKTASMESRANRSPMALSGNRR